MSLPKLLSFIVLWVLYISYAFGIGSSIETRNTARNLIRTLLSLSDILVRTAFCLETGTLHVAHACLKFTS